MRLAYINYQLLLTLFAPKLSKLKYMILKYMKKFQALVIMVQKNRI